MDIQGGPKELEKATKYNLIFNGIQLCLYRIKGLVSLFTPQTNQAPLYFFFSDQRKPFQALSLIMKISL